MPPCNVRLLTQEGGQIVYQQVEPLVQIGTDEPEPKLNRDIDTGASPYARVDHQAVFALHEGLKEVLDDVPGAVPPITGVAPGASIRVRNHRSEEHTSELQSRP